MNNVLGYSIFLLVAFTVTVFVGRDLHKNGYYLVLELFDNESFANNVNNLLLTGYYLVNLGLIALSIGTFGELSSTSILVEVLSSKLGQVLLVLGVLHFNNIIVLHYLSGHKKRILKLFNT